MTHKVKKIYHNLEQLHHTHGLVLHTSVFCLSLFIGIALGVGTMFVRILQVKDEMKQVKQHEHQIMAQLVSKMEKDTPLSYTSPK
jgi:hypothetical protein